MHHSGSGSGVLGVGGELPVNDSVSFSTATNTRPSVTNVTAVALASNTARKYACFTNNTGATMYLKLGASAVVNQGIPLGPNDSYEITLDKLYTGAVNVIKSTATATNLDVIEGT